MYSQREYKFSERMKFSDIIQVLRDNKVLSRSGKLSERMQILRGNEVLSRIGNLSDIMKFSAEKTSMSAPRYPAALN